MVSSARLAPVSKEAGRIGSLVNNQAVVAGPGVCTRLGFPKEGWWG